MKVLRNPKQLLSVLALFIILLYYNYWFVVDNAEYSDRKTTYIFPCPKYRQNSHQNPIFTSTVYHLILERDIMKLFLLLTSILSVNAGVIKQNCSIININGKNFEPEILKEGLDRPYLLTVDYSTNIVYFSYSVKDEDEGSKTARLNLNTKEFADIKGVNNGFAQTVDQITHEIYIGGSDGIYKYYYGNDRTEFLGERDVNIWTIYFKDVLYYSIYPSQFLYTFSEGQSTRFKDLEDTKVDNFVIDNQNVIFFTNATGLYSQQKGTKDAVLFKDNVIGVRGLTTDLTGKVYACLQDGIYLVNKDTVAVEKLVEIVDAFGVAFDIDNNIVYADDTKLVRLKPTKNESC